MISAGERHRRCRPWRGQERKICRPIAVEIRQHGGRVERRLRRQLADVSRRQRLGAAAKWIRPNRPIFVVLGKDRRERRHNRRHRHRLPRRLRRRRGHDARHIGRALPATGQDGARPGQDVAALIEPGLDGRKAFATPEHAHRDLRSTRQHRAADLAVERAQEARGVGLRLHHRPGQSAEHQAAECAAALLPEVGNVGGEVAVSVGLERAGLFEWRHEAPVCGESRHCQHAASCGCIR